VNWNGREHTLACLRSIEPQLEAFAGQGGAVVTVVDNGSIDGSAGAVATSFPQVRLIRLDSNRGFTGGLAAAVSTSAARNVIFLNNDAIAEEGWLAALTRAIESEPDDVIAIGGKIIDISGRLIDFIGGMLTFDGHAFQNGFRDPLGSRPEPEAGAEILFACGGNMIARRQPLLDLGGFDDDYFAYLEDVDFGWRAWLSGFRVLWEPRAVVRHASSATSDRLGSFERGVLFERNALQTAIKNYEADLLHDLAGPIFFTYLHRLHHYAVRRNPRAQELTREPFTADPPPSPAPTLWRRVKRRIRRFLQQRLFPQNGADALAAIDDPLTAMQFRAFDWIVRNGDRIGAKRSEVQRRRKRSDAEIFARFPLTFVPTYPGDEELMQGALFHALRPAVPSVDRKLGDIMRT
jgi:GT2 family glycosyltransferase